MAIYQFWRTLRDLEGRPVEGASVSVYLAGTSTLANIYNGTNVSITNPLTTNSSGVFSFYVRNYAEISGYAATQKFKLTWSGATTAGVAVIGSIDNINIFPNLFQVDETTTSDAAGNKLVSNELAYDWDTHPNLTWEDEAHGIEGVDETDPNDSTPNKLVSNYLMNELDSLLTSAQSPFISSSGAVVVTINVGTSGSGKSVKWIPSAAPSGTYLYADIDHNLNIKHPIVQIYESSGAAYYPWRIDSIDQTSPYTTIRVWSVLDVDSTVTVIG